VVAALQAAILEDHTLILVTHKAELLSFVDRVIVVAGQKIVMDGPKDIILQKLSQRDVKAVATQ
jgi:ATP-binding cassette subfamily C protein LapB